uniref:Uncharacterized protein n=1 Tax=Opuntia streptacantha TaxID=393608 RepID=A0A7C8ZCC2_OPUST
MRRMSAEGKTSNEILIGSVIMKMNHSVFLCLTVINLVLIAFLFMPELSCLKGRILAPSGHATYAKHTEGSSLMAKSLEDLFQGSSVSCPDGCIDDYLIFLLCFD